MAMTVADLRKMLANYPDEFEVVLGKDPEGNGFSPLWKLDAGEYVAVTTWSGEFKHPDDQEGPDNAVCLWPVN